MGYKWKVLNEISEDSFMAKPITPIEDLQTMAKQSMKHRMEVIALQVQADVCKKLGQIEGKSFRTDRWEREEGGGYIVCVLEDGDVIEKAGITAAVIHGKLPAQAAKMMKAKIDDLDEENITFYSASVSCIIHPTSPYIPTMHFSYRYFEADGGSGKKMAWFGGGQDLTPYYIVEEDITHFHKVLKDVCDKYDKDYHPKFKKWADDYFFNPFRGEHRGVGGIFFDDLEGPDLELCYDFVSNCCDAIQPAYIPIVEKHMKEKYTAEEKQWQNIRRGRYVEFNLVCDRGTKFGFSAPGVQVEAFLVSLPNVAQWKYMHVPEENSKEHMMIEALKNPRDWV